MKAFTRSAAAILLAALCVFSVGCIGETRSFTYSWDTLTDGETVYRRFPDGYEYNGELPVRIGTVDGGSALLASDDGVFVKQSKGILDDMDYVPFAREDFEFPKPDPDNCSVKIDMLGITLSKNAKEEFFSLWKELKAEGGEKKPGFSNEEYAGSARLSFYGSAGLEYDCGLSVYKREGKLFIGGAKTGYAVIDKDSELYKEIAAG